PAGGAPAVDPAVPAAAGAPAAGAAPATPVDAAPAAANPAPAAADPAAAGAPPAAAEGGEVIAPNAADAAADPAVPPVTLPDTLPDTAAISPELEPLLGLWVNESETDDQPIAKINLASDGNAVVTVNTALGQQEVRKPFSVEDGTFKLDGSELAKVISANADKVVLDATGTNLTFGRPSSITAICPSRRPVRSPLRTGRLR